MKAKWIELKALQEAKKPELFQPKGFEELAQQLRQHQPRGAGAAKGQGSISWVFWARVACLSAALVSVAKHDFLRGLDRLAF